MTFYLTIASLLLAILTFFLRIAICKLAKVAIIFFQMFYSVVENKLPFARVRLQTAAILMIVTKGCKESMCGKPLYGDGLSFVLCK